MSTIPFHVIKDPVHGTMQFTSQEDAWVKPFIDSPQFQRLRHIKQLGLGDYIFPGAVHSRFNHSIGCCYVGSQIAHKIGLSDEERQLVMIACLLHDMGHGPFSHAFEGIFHDKLIRHERWTPYFLADFNTPEFFYVYNKANARHPLSADKFNDIASMIMHQPIQRRVLADIVSSQLDADRLDYLLRDSHFCGVKYGEFDFRWMLHCMTIVNAGEGERLGITHKGIGAVEHYLMARRLMTRNIYHSQKKLAFEQFLVELLANLSASLEHEKSFAAIRHSRLGEFLMAANIFNETVRLQPQHKANLRDAFLKDNADTYKELRDYDVFSVIKQLSNMCIEHPAVLMASRIQHRKMPALIPVDYDNIQSVHEALHTFKVKHRQQYQDWQLRLIETPHQSYSGEDDPILVLGNRGDIKPIGHFSFMIDAISDKLEHVAFLSVDKCISAEKDVSAFIAQIEQRSGQ